MQNTIDYMCKFTLQGEHVDEFSPYLTAPHMDMWPVTVPNKHTDHWFAEKKKQKPEKLKH